MIEDDAGYAAQTEAFLDALLRHRDRTAQLQGLADLLATLVWTNDDNGHHLQEARCRWLREGDLERTELAFAMDDVYPGYTRGQILANVSAAAERFPQFHPKAREILEHWDAAHPGERTESTAPATSFTWEPAPPMSIARAAEFIADHPAPNAPPKFLSEIIDELLPCLTPVARAELHAACEAWAAGDDEWRAGIAAWMETPAPGQTEEDLLRRRAAVVARFPRAAKGESW